METILHYFYHLPRNKTYTEHSLFVKTAHAKEEYWGRLNRTLTEEEKQLLEDYFEADMKLQDILQFDHFRFAFHLGAQLMAELIEGKDVLR